MGAGITMQLIREVIAAARVHFAKEEKVLFPLAKRTVSEELRTTLGARWAEIGGVTLR